MIDWVICVVVMVVLFLVIVVVKVEDFFIVFLGILFFLEECWFGVVIFCLIFVIRFFFDVFWVGGCFWFFVGDCDCEWDFCFGEWDFFCVGDCVGDVEWEWKGSCFYKKM